MPGADGFKSFVKSLVLEQLGGQVVKICFVMELAGLCGRKRLEKYDVSSAIIYEGK